MFAPSSSLEPNLVQRVLRHGWRNIDTLEANLYSDVTVYTAFNSHIPHLRGCQSCCAPALSSNLLFVTCRLISKATAIFIISAVVTLSAQVLAMKGVPVVPIYNETIPLWEFHRDNGDGHECTHFCFPSAPQARRFGSRSWPSHHDRLQVVHRSRGVAHAQQVCMTVKYRTRSWRCS